MQLSKRAARSTLSAFEIELFLAEQTWGVLASVGDDGPYAVPVSYVLEGGEVYFACGRGQKLRYLQENPAVCLTVTEVAHRKEWRSVVVRGEVEWVEEPLARIRILRALLSQDGARPTLEGLGHAARGAVCRIRAREVSGRARGGAR